MIDRRDDPRRGPAGAVCAAGVLLVLAAAGCGSPEAIIHRGQTLDAGGHDQMPPADGGAGGGGGGTDAAPDLPVQQATCTDGAKNGAETDTDCGGNGGCPVCKVGQACIAATDCENGVCTNSFCQPAGCGDVKQNGMETDVDCGGLNCAACAAGKKCAVNADCQDQVCTAAACQVPKCNDTIKNGSESDVDCGGTMCPKCA